MSEFRISRIRYTWKGDWQSSFDYQRDDIVKYGAGSWVCIRKHTSSAFKTDQEFLANQDDTDFSPAWIRMTQGVAYRGDWNTSVLYNPGDVIQYGGVLYLALFEHTSSAFPDDISNWEVYANTVDYKNTWQTSTSYGVGDLVRYGGNVYKCINPHTSADGAAAGLELNQTDWEVYVSGKDFKGSWSPDVRYKVNDLVVNSGYLWKAKKGHTSASDSTLNFDSNEFWETELPGFEYDGEWSDSVDYAPGDVVKHGGFLYESLTDNYNVRPYAEFQNPDWRILSKGSNFRGVWSASASYNTGDVVRRGGNLYVAIVDILSDGSSLDYLDADWEIIVQGQNWRNAWQVGIEYDVNDVVIYRGKTYICTFAHTASFSPRQNQPGNNEPLIGDDYWDLLVGLPFNVGMDSRGDLLTFGLRNIELGDDSSLGLTDVEKGDPGKILTVNSTDDPEFIEFGESNRVFYVRTDGVDDENDPRRGISPFYPYRTVRFACEAADDGFAGTTTVNVATGVFEEVLPITIPARTVVLGSELRSTTIKPNQPRTDLIEGGDYAYFNQGLARISQLVQTVLTGATLNPAKTSSNTLDPVVVNNFQNADLRSFDVTVGTGTLFNTQGNGNVFFLNGVQDTTIQLIRGETYTFVQSDPSNADHPLSVTATELGQTPQPLLGSISVTGSSGVDREVQVTIPRDAPNTLYFYCEVHGVEMGGPLSVVDAFVDIPLEVDASTTAAVQSLITNARNKIAFNLASGATNPSTVGTNTETLSLPRQNAARVLEANRSFFEEEVIAFANATFEDYTIDETLYRKQIKRFIDAFAYDLRFTGNFKTLLEARYYINEVQGSLPEDMFYCRDTTGVRNCTLEGLTGTLNPPGVFDLYQRPTGGAYVSLDPGWGPNDDRCWIINRSPYIQGVTTIGFAAIGQKVDGALHNGGNKSITSNDFTQVISDGIGAWVLNGARAELVSVFSYYAQVGYLAELGGIIRSTNGNSSYGNFGVIADGVDPTEVPILGSVFARNQEASILDSIVSGGNNALLAFEWSNFGQNYTEASIDITGSGVEADFKFEEFRDNAMYRARLLDSNDERLVDSIGGGGYVVNQNNAQTRTLAEDATSIRIASSDTNTAEDLIGKRIFIEEGAGAGQFGQISAFNSGTKVVSVIRESDGEPGWDHVVPGRPLEAFNAATTLYRIEPRVDIEDPGFTSTQIDAGVGTFWSAIEYGETTRFFGNITGQLGSGTVVDFDGLEPTAATFDVTKNGRFYEIATRFAGLGYAVGDEIDISGEVVGGTTPENDIVITVTEVTDDSTNEIVDFTFTGKGQSGRWVVTSTQGTAALYSEDGDNWESFNMPFEADWDNLVSGNNRFVAIPRSTVGGDAIGQAAYSDNGENWITRNLPVSTLWSGLAFGDGVFVAVGQTGNTAIVSTDGRTWRLTNIPAFGDSTLNEWVDITYGQGKFVAIANSNNLSVEGTYNRDTGLIDWETHIMDVVSDSAQLDWVSVAYGYGRFVAIASSGAIGYSFDGVSWEEPDAPLPAQDGSTSHVWRKIKYGNGNFLAIGETGSKDIGGDPTDGTSNFIVISDDGIIWKNRELSLSAEYRDLAFGNPYIAAEDSTVGLNTPIWIVPGYNTRFFNKIRTGKKAIGRATVSSGIIGEIKLWDPGSGYQNDPAITIVDPISTSPAIVESRTADGVLSQPEFLSRGFGYNPSNLGAVIFGDGFADNPPVGTEVTLTGLSRLPEIGSQIIFGAIPNERFAIVTITDLGALENTNNGQGASGVSCRLRISPSLRVQDGVEHLSGITIREQIAQARITGHDFLDVGTGNFVETNYPELYQDYDFVAAEENEVYEEDGGRVFYTSTDQSGNFRTGELFAVEQATGIVTISSDFFNLDGLSELRLGGIRVGGSGVVVNEFSTDPTFTADSNNIVPTQRAIAAFLDDRLSLGGATIEVNEFQAGVIEVGPLGFDTVTGGDIVVVEDSEMNVQIDGHLLAQTMFISSFKDDNG